MRKSEIFFFGRKKNSDFQCKNSRFFLKRKKKSSDFQFKNPRIFWTKKTIGVFSVKIRGFFFLKKILCLSCISHGTLHSAWLRFALSRRSRGFRMGEYRKFGSETYIIITTLILTSINSYYCYKTIRCIVIVFMILKFF